MRRIDEVKAKLQATPKTWLITGVAGFIGSSLLEELLKLGQIVVGLDNFSTGKRENLHDVKREVGPERWKSFRFHEGNIRDLDDCLEACEKVDYVLHQAALGSVPKSIDDPILTNQSNIDGFLNILVAARDSGVKRLIYASSSSIYGDSPELPSTEDRMGKPLSPYAVTKHSNELYSGVFAWIYAMETIGLRYFNVFGKRQDPNGPYAAVIPKWILSFLDGQRPTIFGDGKTSRDFCYIDNVVQANLLAATCTNPEAVNKVYNIAFGERITLNRLFHFIRSCLGHFMPNIEKIEPQYGPFREGDVRHSLADIGRAREFLGYDPQYDVAQSLKECVEWYIERAGIQAVFPDTSCAAI